MNQQCKVCGEPAAGFHFGAFTCEGCKSFFGRSYNNLNSITECKNNGECIINKKNRTACKSCRLRKCLLVGMSKSGSRYGRRSNWFKIHCLLQEQQQAAVAQIRGKNVSSSPPNGSPIPLLSPLAFPHANFGNFFRPDNSSSPSISSPDSDSSETALYPARMNGSHPFNGSQQFNGSHPFNGSQQFNGSHPFNGSQQFNGSHPFNGSQQFINKDFYLPVPFHSMFMQSPPLTNPFLLPPSLFPFSVTAAKYTQAERTFSPDQVQNSRKIIPTPDLMEEHIGFTRPLSRCSPLNNNDYSSKNKNNCNDNESGIKFNSNNNDDNIRKGNIINNNGNDNGNTNNTEDKVTMRSKRFYLDTILGLKSSRSPAGSLASEVCNFRHGVPNGFVYEAEQDVPIDLSMKKISFEDNKSTTASKYCYKTSNVEGKEAPAETCTAAEYFKPIPLDLTI